MKKNRGNHSFGKGLVCGALLCVMVMVLGGCGASSLLVRLGIAGLSAGSASSGSSESEMEEKMAELQSYIDAYYLFDYDEEDVQESVYKGMMDGLGDPYTCYYTAEEYASFLESSSGSYSGIGATLQQDYSTGLITVVNTFAGSPAEQAGLLPDDILYMVEGEEVTGIDLNLVVVDLKGEAGTDVNISIVRGSEVIEMTITRASIEVPTVEYEMLEDSIGYIAIMEFDDVTDEQFADAMEDLTSQGMESLIIDLRDNGGGLVDVTCTILDSLLPEGLIVYTEDKYGNREEEYSDAENYFDGEMVVLVNSNTASASEIFAGAIKDYGVGTLIGTQTYGKGIVQSLIPLSDGSAIKITVSRYYTPSGNNIHEVGIAPDIVLEADTESGEDNQLQRAIEVLK
ncbi:MAG: S41 family peptidase [Lachnospiraceae bacterium]|nr:S41 family peptidase [Lachnospiraceae bacterium]